MHSFFAKKIAKKVIRDTWASITYYFAKYHVILCKVSLVSKKAFRLSSVLSHTDSTENTDVEPNLALQFAFFKNTNSSNDTNVEPNSALQFEFLRTRIFRMTRIGSLTRLCLPLSLIKNINQDKHPMLGKLSYFEFLM